ncbi:uncharacterized protein LOC122388945 [Amphibalanus amphitrite]|uniref:uncharacterized protein LOC122388945 n=1 Tax=Amphibalanus amphitrite TaxID=1232801 RepID=UPI001C90ED83|nr:uncharacterized protein LOC122388945 [Amphibalanus amphitrite]
MLLDDGSLTGQLRMLGDLPPLTNGLHEPEPAATSEERTAVGETNATLPPVTRVLPPLRGAPRIASSLSQPEGDPTETTEGGLRRPPEAGELQSVNSAADLRNQADAGQKSAEDNVVASEDGGVCSPLTRLLSRFRKDKSVSHEPVTPEPTVEPKEEPDDESRPEGEALRAGLPAEDDPPAARVDTPAVTAETADIEPDPQETDTPQSKTCSIL